MRICIDILRLLMVGRDRRWSLSRQVTMNLLFGVWLYRTARWVLTTRYNASKWLHAMFRGDAVAFTTISSNLVIGSIVCITQIALRLAIIDHKDFLHFPVVKVIQFTYCSFSSTGWKKNVTFREKNYNFAFLPGYQIDEDIGRSLTRHECMRQKLAWCWAVERRLFQANLHEVSKNVWPVCWGLHLKCRRVVLCNVIEGGHCIHVEIWWFPFG